MYILRKSSIILLLGVLYLANVTHGFEVGDKLDDGKGSSFQWKNYKLNLRIEDRHFVIYFLDEENKVVEAPQLEAVIRAESAMGSKETIFTSMSKPEGREVLYGKRVMWLPYNYWVNLVLKKPGDSGEKIHAFDRFRYMQSAN